MIKTLLDKIIAEAASDCQECTDYCEDFTLFSNSLVTDAYFVRYKRTEMETFTERYRWICFDHNGNRTDCDPQFENFNNYAAFYNAMQEVQALPHLKNNYDKCIKSQN